MTNTQYRILHIPTGLFLIEYYNLTGMVSLTSDWKPVNYSKKNFKPSKFQRLDIIHTEKSEEWSFIFEYGVCCAAEFEFIKLP